MKLRKMSKLANCLTLPSSLAQFFTRLEGHAMMHFSMVGFEGRGDCLTSVQRRAMHWRVFPRPISSAIIHPYWLSTNMPVVHLYRNYEGVITQQRSREDHTLTLTPSTWCGLRTLDRRGSMTTATLLMFFFLSLPPRSSFRLLWGL